MKERFKKYGAEHVHLISYNKDHAVKLVNKCYGFGLTATNSRYFVFGIYTLSMNLDPILLGLGFAK
jgi:hypothetical protein